MMTDLESGCEKIINVFHQYSVRRNDFDKLSLSEFTRLVKEQFPNWLKAPKDPESIQKMFQRADANKDREIDFGEFVNWLVPVMVATHDHIHSDENNF